MPSNAILDRISIDGEVYDLTDRNAMRSQENAVITAYIADEAVTTAKVANKAITKEKLADDAMLTEVNTESIIDLAVTNDKIADTTITSSKFDPEVTIFVNGVIDEKLGVIANGSY